MNRPIFSLILSAALLVGAGCAARPVATTDVVPSTDWIAYHSDALKFSVSYPSELTPTATEGVVDFLSVDGGPWGYRVAAVPVANKDMDAWAAAQADKPTPFFVIDNGNDQTLTIVQASVATDSDRGRPIYSTVLEAVELSNGTAYVITWRNQTPAGTVPTLMDEDTLRFLRSFRADVPPVSADDQAWHEANKVLAQFLGLLHERTYAAAAGRYGGDLSQLREWNPTVDANDAETLWKNGCEMNGLLCMEVASIKPVRHEGDAWTFNVAFTTDDGKPYAKDGMTLFPFVVRAGNDGLYLVETMPLYQE